MPTRSRRMRRAMAVGLVAAAGALATHDASAQAVAAPRAITPGEISASFESVATQAGAATVRVLASGLAVDAAPSNIVRSVYEQLTADGRVRRGTIGALVRSNTSALADGLQLPQESGAVVADVDAGGPGAKGGLRIGDIVVALDGKAIANGRQLGVNLYRRAAGTVATLDVLRGRERLRLSVEVDERDDDPMRFAELVTREQHLVPRLGVLAITLNDTLRQQLGLDAGDAGALVASGPARRRWSTASSPGISSWR